jgi:cation diffusion facilitator CzcD-associated flavoprotein CzcO
VAISSLWSTNFPQSEFLTRHVFVPGSWWQKKAIELAWSHLDAQVKDPVVREKLRPHDNFGCKRPLVLDDYYPVFNEPNVELVTDPVVGLSENGVLSANPKAGEEERKVDVLIWGTGRLILIYSSMHVRD